MNKKFLLKAAFLSAAVILGAMSFLTACGGGESTVTTAATTSADGRTASPTTEEKPQTKPTTDGETGSVTTAQKPTTDGETGSVTTAQKPTTDTQTTTEQSAVTSENPVTTSSKPVSTAVTDKGKENPVTTTVSYVEGTPTYAEAYRPQYHYSCKNSWMNDINGTVYFNGVWHMYYQCGYGILSNSSICWGHATSTDLIHWTEQKVAIPTDSNQIWSGTAWADTENKSGLFKTSKGGIIAAYSTEKQTVGIAYSEDGMTFTKIGIVIKNPGPGTVDFRDPKLFYDESNGKWTILVAGGKVRFYQSDDLKNWTLTSENEIYTECPDFFTLKDEDGKEKWVLSCAGRGFYVGSYKNGKFTPESDLIITSVGPDSYASIIFENAPDGRKLMVGWMNRWEYAQETATEWVSNATIVSELKLTKKNGEYSVGFSPVNDYDKIVSKTLVNLSNKTIKAGDDLLAGKKASLVRLTMKVDLTKTTDFTLKLAVGDGDATVLKYNKENSRFVFDRSASIAGCDAISTRNPLSVVNRSSDGNTLEITVYVDTAGFEMFIDNCEYFAALIRPQASSKGMSLTTDGTLSVVSLKVDELSSIWFDDASKVNAPQVSTDKVVLSLEKPSTSLVVAAYGGSAKIYCESGNGKIADAKISGNKLVITAKKVGSTEITVRVGNRYVKIPVTVNEKEPSSMIGNFTVSGGTLETTENGIKLISNGGDAFAFSDSEGGDFVFESDITLTAANTAGSLLFRMNGLSDFYCVNVDAGSGGVKLWMKKNGAVNVLKWYPTEVKLETTYHLSVKAVGSSLTVSLDGKELFTVKDSAHTYGSFGLNVWIGSAIFDNIKYTAVGESAKPDSDMTFTVMGGSLAATPDGYKFTCTSGDGFARGSIILSDFTYSADVTVTDGSNAGALVFRMTDGDNFYCLTLDRAAGVLKLWKKDRGYITVVKEVSVVVEAGKSNNLTVEAVGNKITAKYNGEEAFTLTDSSHSYGSLGINVYRGTVIFNHIDVTEK